MTTAMPYLLFQYFILFETLQCAFDDLVLHTRSQFGEEGTETGYTNHKVAVFFRVFLRIPEDVCIQHIELDVIAIIIKQGLDQSQHILPALAGLQLIRREFHVHVCCSVLDGILSLRRRHHQCSGPLTSVPGMADKLPSVRATPALLPLGNAPVTIPIRLWILLV